MPAEDADEPTPAPLSPRVVGVVLMVLGLAGGLLAIIFIPRPEWGIVAAVGLAVASVVFVAGLLTVQRKGWDDTTWPPGMRSKPLDYRRARRSMLGIGIFTIVLSVGGIITLLLGAAEDPFQATRTWVLVVLLLLSGVAFTIAGARPLRDTLRASDRPTTTVVQDDAGWTRLGPDGSAADPSTTIASVYSVYQVPSLIVLLSSVLPELSVITALVIGGVVVVTGAAIVLVLVDRRRAPWVSPDGGSVRRGRRTLRASEITAAFLFASPRFGDAPQRSLALTLQGTDGFTARVGLRRRGLLVLNDRESGLLNTLISPSTIALPRDTYDPSGRFSRTLYPDHLTKQKALDVAADPPGDGEPLPIATQPPS